MKERNDDDVSIGELFPDTRAVHAGQNGNFSGALPSPPLHLNSAILLGSIEEGREMLTDENRPNIAYQRYTNPTILVLEQKFAEMEGAKYALAFNTGMTACYMVFRAYLKRGDHVVAAHSLYHEISDQLKFDVEACGVDVTFVDEYTAEGFLRAFTPKTKMVFIESPTNPAMFDIDIRSLASACRARKVLLVVDNTLLTQEFQKPLGLGADIALCSTTKQINGHGDAMGAVVTFNEPALLGPLKFMRENTGTIIDPFSAFLTIRGMRTLRIRLSKQQANAEDLIKFLQGEYPEVELRYPGFCRHSKANELTGCGGIISMILPSKEHGTAFMKALRMIRIGTTFGNLESLVYHFSSFTRPHRNIEAIGIPPGLVRLSMGIEDSREIVSDVAQALSRAFDAHGRPGATQRAVGE